MEVKEQTASQDYDCQDCDVPIPEETRYVRVVVKAKNTNRRTKHGKLPADIIEKYHPSCWEEVMSRG